MDHKEFRVKAKEMVDFIADYLENVRDRRVCPDVKPGFLHRVLPDTAPAEPEPWDNIFKDFDDIIMPGLVHWQSPHMHAYFPALTSYPSILGDLLANSLNVLCFTWASSPAGTELETIAMNWLGKALGLPSCFLNELDHSSGGGVIQTTASESTLVSLLAARARALQELSSLNPELSTADLLGHLICYCSDQAHSSVEKAGLIGLVRMRYVESDSHQRMRGDKLEEAIRADKEKGLVPFWDISYVGSTYLWQDVFQVTVCATLGTTGTTAFDVLSEVGPVCHTHSLWLHVDAAYAGSAFICPEYRHWLEGVEMADSFAFNPSKWMMVNFDCTAMWVKDSTALHKTFNVNPIYLRHENSGKAIDYMVGATQNKLNTINTIPEKPNPNGTIFNTDNDIKHHKMATGHAELNTHKLTSVTTDKNGFPKLRKIPTTGDTKYDIGDTFGQNCLYEDDVNGDLFGKEDIQLEDPNKREYIHWQIPLSRRFRALKLWFVLRNFGISGIQKHIRESVRLAQKFEALVQADPRFEIPVQRTLGLVAFRLKGDNTLTERLLKRMNGRGKVHCVPACFKGVYVIRFTVTSQNTTNQDIVDDWIEIKTVASEILTETFGSEQGNIEVARKPKISLKDTRELNVNFGTSLLLANSPMSPKIVNGTHAALMDYEQVLVSCAHKFAQLNMEPKDSPEMRRRIRGMRACGKKFSLDSCMDLVQGLIVENIDVLPQCSEEEREDLASNGSSPGGDGSSLNSPPLPSSVSPKNDDNQLSVPITTPSRFRSKSVDMSLSQLKLEDANFSIDTLSNEITITPTGIKSFNDTVLDEEGGQTNGSPHLKNESKLTIKGPGSYIKKLIQQFSEYPETEDPKPEADRFNQVIKEKADAICKKCLHYKDKIAK